MISRAERGMGSLPIEAYTEQGLYSEIAEILKNKPPIGVGVILDGNRRWANANGLLRRLGHEKGKDKTKDFLRFFEGLPVNALLWAFSTANWDRPDDEKKDLFKLYAETITNELLPEALKKNAIIIHYGRKEPLLSESGKILIPGLPDPVLEALTKAKEKTKDNTGQIIGLAINYSGEDELTRIYDRFQKAKYEGLIGPNVPFTRPYWHQFSDDGGRMKDLRCLVRTSGEQRTSGFGWRADYAEPYVIEKNLPDVDRRDIGFALLKTLTRAQRFGK